CDLRLQEEAVSPVHAVLFELEGAWHVRDLNSLRGTYVNGESIHKQELHPGDTLRIADTVMKFQEQPPAEEPAREAAAAQEESEAVSEAEPTPAEALGDRIPLADDSLAPI